MKALILVSANNFYAVSLQYDEFEATHENVSLLIETDSEILRSIDNAVIVAHNILESHDRSIPYEDHVIEVQHMVDLRIKIELR